MKKLITLFAMVFTLQCFGNSKPMETETKILDHLGNALGGTDLSALGIEQCNVTLLFHVGERSEFVIHDIRSRHPLLNYYISKKLSGTKLELTEASGSLFKAKILLTRNERKHEEIPDDLKTSNEIPWLVRVITNQDSACNPAEVQKAKSEVSFELISMERK